MRYGIALLIIALIIAGGTNKTFTLDLSEPIQPVISSLSPGETVHIVITVPNPHSAPITAKVRLLNVVCDENGVVEPEEAYYLANQIADPPGKNDIDTVITVGVWIDRDGDTSSCNTGAGDEWITQGSYVDEIEDQSLSLGTIESGMDILCVLSVHMDAETENWAQSDTLTYDIEITREELTESPLLLSPAYLAGAVILVTSLFGGILLWRRRSSQHETQYGA